MAATFKQIEGGLWGLLVGDAMGVPYEFHSPREIPPLKEIEMIPPAGFSRSHAHVPPGTWSDDGAQALCLAASMLHDPRLDLPDFAERLQAWAKNGYMAVSGKVFDIGIQTGSAIRRLANGVPPLESGLNGEGNNGNGSLMRVLPLALFYDGDDVSLVELAHRQSLVTHAHPRSQACCALYCLWARCEIEGLVSPWGEAVARLRGIYRHKSIHREELEKEILPAEKSSSAGSGYVVDSLHSARVACQEEMYGDIVRAAIALGNDTDTTACISGGIAGIRYGKAGIPAAWSDAMRGREIVVSLLEQVVASR